MRTGCGLRSVQQVTAIRAVKRVELVALEVGMAESSMKVEEGPRPLFGEVANSVRPMSPTISVWPVTTNHGSSLRAWSVTSSEMCSGVCPGVWSTSIWVFPVSRTSPSSTPRNE